MQRNRKRVVLGAAWFASLALANYVGGAIGFDEGYRTALGMQGPRAFATSITLRALRRGSVPEAINILEHQLDDEIAASVSGDADRTFRSPYDLWARFNLRALPRQNAAALGQVLRYREEHPPVAPDASVNAALMQKLGAYRNAPGGRE